MPAITAILHTENDALRLGRCLETLYPCDHIVIIDHNSSDGTVAVARDYGASVVDGGSGGNLQEYLADQEEWILCLDPRESLSESLAASLFEWKTARELEFAYSFFIREETAAGWIAHPSSQARLVPAKWNRWHGNFPVTDRSAIPLEGPLLRFAYP
jgi:glycosyltransferase involved in cell wall biosynthesis